MSEAGAQAADAAVEIAKSQPKTFSIVAISSILIVVAGVLIFLLSGSDHATGSEVEDAIHDHSGQPHPSTRERLDTLDRGQTRILEHQDGQDRQLEEIKIEQRESRKHFDDRLDRVMDELRDR